MILGPELKEQLANLARANGRVTVLTGAGISAESGIPTFRGEAGYWTIGSALYQPQEMATNAMFRRQPEEVWRWYLYRRGVCRAAEPNTGHLALVELENHLADRFTLITQNIDGLHLQAGNTLSRTFQIHGNIDFMRCINACTWDIYPLPPEIPLKSKDDALLAAESDLLRCPRCSQWTRPHVLWFDEYYNEEYFSFQSSLRVASKTDLLIIVGTSGATNLPLQVGFAVEERGGLIIDINLQENIFSELALSVGGRFIQQSSSQALPVLVEALCS